MGSWLSGFLAASTAAVLAASALSLPSAAADALGASVTAEFTAAPARYTPGTVLTVAVAGTLTTTAKRDVACHSIQTRVLAGSALSGGLSHATRRENLS